MGETTGAASVLPCACVTGIFSVIKGFADKDGNQDVTLFDAKDQQMNFLLAGKQDNIITQAEYDALIAAQTSVAA